VTSLVDEDILLSLRIREAPENSTIPICQEFITT
jgi:hypothetical protein